MVRCAAILLCGSQALFAADTISGTVRNGTTGRPATGDEVVLLRLDRSPHEEARTKIDAQGGFTFDLRDPGHPHIVRVTHQGVSYDRQVNTGGAISIDVFDATAKAPGVTGVIEILRAGTQGNALHVSDMIEIRNESNPPVTQAGRRSFEVYLPASATIDSVLAAGPEKVAYTITAEPVSGEPGHYAVNFPVRPGATKFAFNYDLPYNGHAKLRTKSIYPFQQFGVMIPTTMTFASQSSGFKALPVGADRYHVETVENVKAGADLEFEISGTGAIPGMQAQNQARPNTADAPNAPAATAGESAPVVAAEAAPSAKAAPIARSAAKTSARSSNAWWWVLGIAGLGLIVSVFVAWRRQRMHVRASAAIAKERPPVEHSPESLVDALKEGLFQLESDRMQGLIGGEDYVSAKRALEGTIGWAVARAENRRAGKSEEMTTA